MSPTRDLISHMSRTLMVPKWVSLSHYFMVLMHHILKTMYTSISTTFALQGEDNEISTWLSPYSAKSSQLGLEQEMTQERLVLQTVLVGTVGHDYAHYRNVSYSPFPLLIALITDAWDATTSAAWHHSYNAYNNRISHLRTCAIRIENVFHCGILWAKRRTI